MLKDSALRLIPLYTEREDVRNAENILQTHLKKVVVIVTDIIHMNKYYRQIYPEQSFYLLFSVVILVPPPPEYDLEEKNKNYMSREGGGGGFLLR
jgi:hypothetical protein